MKLKKWCERNAFLLRLIIMSATVIGAAILLSVGLVAREAQQQIEQSNRTYRQETTHSLADGFHEQMLQMLGNSLMARGDSMLSRSTIESHVFHQIEAVAALRKYKAGNAIAGEMCLYYPGANYVISSNAKYNLDFFLKTYLGCNDETLAGELADFVRRQPQKYFDFFSTFGRVSESDARFIIAANSRSENRCALPSVFYLIDAATFGKTFSNVVGDGKFAIAVLDQKGGILCQNTFMQTGFVEAALSGSESYRFGAAKYQMYTWDDSRDNLKFITAFPAEDMEQRLLDYSRAMQWTIWYSTALLLIMMVLSVWISYSPVRSVADQARAARGGDDESNAGELQSLMDMIRDFGMQSEQVSSLLNEQKLTLMDDIMNNLLYGLAIDEEKFRQTGLATEGRMLYVISVTGLNRLDHDARRDLEEQLLRREGCDLLILDPPDQNSMILVCSIPREDEIQPYIALVGMVMHQYTQSSLRIGVGNGVAQVDGLHLSYLNALSALSQGGAVTYYNDLVKSYNAIEFYPTNEVLSFVRDMENGNQVEMLLALDKIEKYLGSQVSSMIHERYICYNLIFTFVRLAEKLESPISKDDMDRMLIFHEYADLRRTLSALALDVCEKVAQRAKKAEEESKNKVVAYVDEHFTDANLSLVVMSDVFGLSIYTLSRIFKEAAGIGFKECVTAKRMKRAKELLLSSGLSVKEIALLVGCEKPEYFAKLFKGYYGSTPTDLRRGAQILDAEEGAAQD